MRSTRLPFLILVGLLVLCFGLAAWLDLWFQTWQGNRTQSADVLSVLMGDSRRLFANHFFVKADAYFHSGFYPTVFDNREAFQTPHVAEDSGTVGGRNRGDEQGFLGKPRDWIDAFSRQFFPARHTHLDEGGASGDLGDSSQVREIMPWLRLSAELNPNDIRTYTVAAYWLRERMGKVAEAEQFLREGLRENLDSYEIMYELGRVYSENKNDQARARNLWEAALRQWQKQEAPMSDPEASFCSLKSPPTSPCSKKSKVITRRPLPTWSCGRRARPVQMRSRNSSTTSGTKCLRQHWPRRLLPRKLRASRPDLPPMMLLEISDLKKSFLTPDGSDHCVVNVKTFVLGEQAQAALEGESGSGKTTFLHLIAGILKPDAGRIVLAGREMSALKEPARDRLRATTIGYIFQTFNLLQGYTCLENVLLGMSFGPGADRNLAEKLLKRVGLGQRLAHYPRQLSSGQQQRVAVARALANKPKLVLADEPTGNLDHKSAGESLALIREACRENEAALLLVSHDREVLGQFEHVADFHKMNRAFAQEVGT